jgi:hypothetical protein
MEIVASCFSPRPNASEGAKAISFHQKNKNVFFALVGLQFFCYTYFYTNIIFTNHTFPNVWLSQYPSYRTLEEGRWLHDLIFLVQGSAGTQSALMIVGTIVQAINGILLATLLSLTKPWKVFLVGGLLCTYPAFLDYYVFASDHISFCLGDTFVILGALCFLHFKKTGLRIALPSILFVLSIASYQPKIALIGLFSIFMIPLAWLKKAERNGVVALQKIEIIKDTLLVFIINILAVSTYWFSSKSSIVHSMPVKTYINTFSESLDVILKSYRSFFSYYTNGLGGIPPTFEYVPIIIIIGGLIFMFLTIYTASPTGSLLFLLLAAALPFALYSSYIINKNSWNSGRILFVNGYLLALTAGFLLRLKIKPLMFFSSVLIGLNIYFFCVLANQQTNAAMIKSIQDLNFINRLATSLEKFTASGSRPLLVIGDPPPFALQMFVKHPPRLNTAHVFTPTFVDYRQIEMINFFLGRNMFYKPTIAQVANAIPTAESKKPWPSPESVFQINDMVVLVLEKYRPGIRMTWASDR